MESLPDAAIGALIALSGVLAAQLIAMWQSFLERRNQKNILLRSKYEELMSHLNDSLPWANNCLRATTFDSLNADSQPIQARRAIL